MRSSTAPGPVSAAAKTIHSFLQEIVGSGPDDEVPKAVTEFVRECQLMSTLRHPNIVQFLGVCFLQGSRLPALVMERLLTSLHDLLDPETQPPPGAPTPLSFFTISLKCSVLHDVASGLAYLHERSPPVIHRDFSARNVLLNSGLVGKIADLGVARIGPCVRAAATMTTAPGAGIYTCLQRPLHLLPLILRCQNMMPVSTCFHLELSPSSQLVRPSPVTLSHPTTQMRRVDYW